MQAYELLIDLRKNRLYEGKNLEEERLSEEKDTPVYLFQKTHPPTQEPFFLKGFAVAEFAKNWVILSKYQNDNKDEKMTQIDEERYSVRFPAVYKMQKQGFFAKYQGETQNDKGFEWTEKLEPDFEIKRYGKLLPYKTNPGLDSEEKLKAGIAWSQGARRNMEDAHLATELDFTLQIGEEKVTPTLYGIFDGHGGSAVSEYVAKELPEYFQEAIAEEIKEKTFDEEVIANAFTKAFVRLNKTCRKKFKSGTTAVCALKIGKQVYVANVGDSRATFYNKTETRQLTEDAKPQNRRFRKAVEKGFKMANDKDFRVNGKKNRVEFYEDNQLKGGIAMGRAIGDPLFMLSARPKITTVEGSGLVVLACDGLWDVASTHEVGEAIRKMKGKGFTEKEMAEQLTLLAMKKGSTDNVSVMVVPM